MTVSYAGSVIASKSTLFEICLVQYYESTLILCDYTAFFFQIHVSTVWNLRNFVSSKLMKMLSKPSPVFCFYFSESFDDLSACRMKGLSVQTRKKCTVFFFVVQLFFFSHRVELLSSVLLRFATDGRRSSSTRAGPEECRPRRLWVRNPWYIS